MTTATPNTGNNGNSNNNNITLNLQAQQQQQIPLLQQQQLSSWIDVQAITQSQLRPFCIPLTVLFAIGILNLLLAIIVFALLIESKVGYDTGTLSTETVLPRTDLPKAFP